MVLWVLRIVSKQLILPDFDKISIILLSAIISIFSFLGDIGMWLLKRAANLQETGAYFPGPGGVLDKLSLILLAIPAVFYYLKAFPL